VPKWSKLAEEGTRTVIMPSLDGNGAFALAAMGKGFPL
jgi:hypothetical protein